MKGSLTHHFVFASFEDGTERRFEIHGKDIVECNDRLKEFIDEVGEENYAACKFPEELLKDSFFDARRRCFQEYRLNVHPYYNGRGRSYANCGSSHPQHRF